MNKIAPRISLLVLMVTPALAIGGPMQEGTSYGGFNFSQLTSDADGISEDANPTALIGRLGYFFADQFAIEGRLGTGLSDDTVRVEGFGVVTDVDLELDHLFGAYLVGHLPLGQAASVYGMLGFTNAKATASTQGFSVTASDSGLSYGFGADVYASERFGLNLEYTQYLDEIGYDVSALSVGAKFMF